MPKVAIKFGAHLFLVSSFLQLWARHLIVSYAWNDVAKGMLLGSVKSCWTWGVAPTLRQLELRSLSVEITFFFSFESFSLYIAWYLLVWIYVWFAITVTVKAKVSTVLLQILYQISQPQKDTLNFA